jgi:lipoate synthase
MSIILGLRKIRMSKYSIIAKLRPDTYNYNIESIYRVRDPIDKSKEFYFYQKKGKISNQNDDPEYTNSHTYGFAVEPECELRWNPKIKSKEPVKIKDNLIYFFKWDKKEVAKLLAQSEEPCFNFYIGTAGRKGNKDSVADVMAVKNKHDLLDGSFEDLVILNKSGLMVTEESTLHLVEKAKKKLEDKAVEKVTSQTAAINQQ